VLPRTLGQTTSPDASKPLQPISLQLRESKQNITPSKLHSITPSKLHDYPYETAIPHRAGAYYPFETENFRKADKEAWGLAGSGTASSKVGLRHEPGKFREYTTPEGRFAHVCCRVMRKWGDSGRRAPEIKAQGSRSRTIRGAALRSCCVAQQEWC
jgi:hypothetical protein